MGMLTVRENISFSAALRLPKSVTSEDREQRVSELIEDLGLSKVADSKVRFFPTLFCGAYFGILESRVHFLGF